MVTLYCVVHGPAYERYAEQLRLDVARWFMPGEDELQFLTLPGRPGPRGHNWPYVSATRYRVLLDHLDRVRGDHVFHKRAIGLLDLHDASDDREPFVALV